MSTGQNTQLRPYPTALNALKLLKFCYILMPLLLLSCAEDKTKKTSPETTTSDPTETTMTAEKKSKTILCFGDSITAGYGLDDTNDAYPGILQQKIDAANLNYTVVNSGVSGETTAGGKSRIDWVIKQPADIFLLELGANDGLRGVPLSETRSNLQSIINVVKKESPQTIIILAGMELPPNLGEAYTTEFRQLYADLAKENDLAFIPFILKEVGGDPALNQGDGIHPNLEGHQVVANTVWEVMAPLLTK